MIYRKKKKLTHSSQGQLALAKAFPFQRTSESFTLHRGRPISYRPPEEMSDRHPFLLYGHWYSPEYLPLIIDTAVYPLSVQRGRLSDHDVVYASGLTAYLAIQDTLRHVSNSVMECGIAWISTEQRKAFLARGSIDGYRLVTLSHLPLVLDAGSAPQKVDTLLTKHQHLSFDGRPVSLDTVQVSHRVIGAAAHLEVLMKAGDSLLADSKADRLIEYLSTDEFARSAFLATLESGAIPRQEWSLIEEKKGYSSGL